MPLPTKPPIVASASVGDAPRIALLCSQRSENLGDRALLESAVESLRDALGKIDIRVFGLIRPGADLRVGFVPSSLYALLPGLWFVKARLLNRNAADERSSSRAISRGVTGLAMRGALALLCIAGLLMAGFRRWMRLPLPRRLANVFDELQDADSLVSTGGGWINSEFPVTLYENLAIVCIARFVHRKPVYFIGEQVGPLTNHIDRAWVRFGFKHASLIAVRDPRSLVAAKELLARTHIELSGDWTYRPTFTAPRANRDGRLRVGVNLRRAHYSMLTSGDLRQLASALKSLHSRTACEMHLVPMCSSPHESDPAVLAELAELIDLPEHVRRHPPQASVDAARELIATMDLNVGVSFHFCLWSLAAGVPCLGLATGSYYDSKMRGLFELFEVRERLLSNTDLIEPGPAEALSRLAHESSEVGRRLRETNRRLLDRHAAVFRDLFTAIQNDFSRGELRDHECLSPSPVSAV